MIARVSANDPPLATPTPALRRADGDSLRGLAVPVPPIASDARGYQAVELFATDPTLLAIPVVDDQGAPVGILNRFTLLHTLSGVDGQRLVLWPVADLMNASPLIADEDASIDLVAEALADDRQRHFFDGFIVTRAGRYIGVGTGQTVMRRLTERRQAVLFHVTHHDPLTGLPNRQLFEDRLSQALAAARRSGRQVGILCIDVDHLKNVNHSVGHAMADRLLGSFADRLSGLVREQDTIARLSGDKFAVLLAEMPQAASAEVVARKVLEACRKSHHIDGHDLSLSCSIGISVFPDDAETRGELLRAASDAVHSAKQVRHTFARYNQGMQRPAASMPLAFSSVRRALEAGHLDVHYQPTMRITDGRITGVEALVRWVDPERGLMSTIELIRAAEETGLIVPLSEHVMRVALREARLWRDASGSQLALAVNISGVQFRGGGLVPMVSRLLEESGFPPEALVLEITETTAMQSTSAALSALDDLRALGIRMAVDDFGTGYSSLSRLHRLPVDAVKLDRSFVQGLGPSADTAVIAKTIITMAHSLGLKVTAEGVENQCELDALSGYGCDEAQGFLLSVPLDATLLPDFLSRTSAGARPSPEPSASL
jgi:diguanylate cyclase (GGDEF)-like protein